MEISFCKDYTIENILCRLMESWKLILPSHDHGRRYLLNRGRWSQSVQDGQRRWMSLRPWDIITLAAFLKTGLMCYQGYSQYPHVKSTQLKMHCIISGNWSLCCHDGSWGDHHFTTILGDPGTGIKSKVSRIYNSLVSPISSFQKSELALLL